MEENKSNQEKTMAIASAVVLVAAIFSILIAAVATMTTKGNFATALTEMTAHELPVINKIIISIPALGYGIFCTLLILILILKELYIRAKTVTLAFNIVTGLAAIVYLPVYIGALFIPMLRY